MWCQLLHSQNNSVCTLPSSIQDTTSACDASCYTPRTTVSVHCLHPFSTELVHVMPAATLQDQQCVCTLPSAIQYRTSACDASCYTPRPTVSVHCLHPFSTELVHVMPAATLPDQQCVCTLPSAIQYRTSACDASCYTPRPTVSVHCHQPFSTELVHVMLAATLPDQQCLSVQLRQSVLTHQTSWGKKKLCFHLLTWHLWILCFPLLDLTPVNSVFLSSDLIPVNSAFPSFDVIFVNSVFPSFVLIPVNSVFPSFDVIYVNSMFPSFDLISVNSVSIFWLDTCEFRVSIFWLDADKTWNTDRLDDADTIENTEWLWDTNKRWNTEWLMT